MSGALIQLLILSAEVWFFFFTSRFLSDTLRDKERRGKKRKVAEEVRKTAE